MRIRTSVLLPVLASVTVYARSPDAKIEAVKHANAQRIRALRDRNGEQLARVLGDDLTYVTSAGLVETKEKILHDVRAGFSTGDREYVDVAARLYGDVAVLTYLSKPLSGGSAPEQRSTCVYIFRDGRWQLVAQQVTRVAGRD